MHSKEVRPTSPQPSSHPLRARFFVPATYIYVFIRAEADTFANPPPPLPPSFLVPLLPLLSGLLFYTYTSFFAI